MKIKYIILCLVLALIGCQRDEEMEITQLTISNERLEPSYSSVAISCNITTNVTIKSAYVYVSESADFSSAIKQVLNERGGNTYTAEVGGLTDETTYYVRYQISNRWVSLIAEEVSEFQTTPTTIPTISTAHPSEITYNSAIIGGTITSNGGQDITSCGVVYSTSPNPTIGNGNKVENKDKSEAFACSLTNLEVVTTYYARAYAVNKKGVAYGEEVSFTTLSTSATMGEISALEISATTAIIQAELLADGGANITQLGICYNIKGEPTTNDSVVLSSINSVGVYQCTLNNLSKATTYYVRAFATNANGMVYSEQMAFKTEATIATVLTTQPTEVAYTSATVGGNVTSDGGASVTERGVCYSTSANPTTANTKISNGTGTGSFTCNLSDLQDGTTYYARAYAVNGKGTAYGEEVSFTTKAKTTATVTSSQPTSISYTSATIGGNVTDDGGLSVTERGVCYSTNANPTTANTKISNGTGIGTFTCDLTDLQDGTTYYVRAYAINEKGTAYGEEVSFSTTAKTIATVTTTQATNVSYTTATVGGNVTSDGGASITECGVCYSTSANPTTSNTKVTNGTGTGSFTCNLSDLQDGTTYYVRAYAVNGKGTAYGEEVSFTTKIQTIATLITTDATNIFCDAATIGGEIINDGGDVISERGIVYSTSQNPTITDMKQTCGNEFSCVLSNLQEESTYYARAYAINKKGVGYGNEVSFTTKERPFENGHEYVDLGLSVKWATCNVGASSPEEYGDCFAWGETEPKEIYDWSTYKWCNGSGTMLTKYNYSYDNGIVDNLSQLELGDDAAHVNWRGSWRMPTEEELRELIDNCKIETSSYNSERCLKFISTKIGYTNNCIYIRIKDSMWSSGHYQFLWTSSISGYESYLACVLEYHAGRWYCTNDKPRNAGLYVRPVCP